MIKNNVKCVKRLDKLKLIIYYKSATTKSLVMRNNQAPPSPALQQTNLIYEYKCTKDDCEHLPEVSYVGLTTTTLSRRITMHLGSGAPKSHTETSHQHSSLTRDIMVENTKIIRKENDIRRLQIYEALIIKQKCPTINNQDTGISRTLKLFNCVNKNRRNLPQPFDQRNTPNSSPPPTVAPHSTVPSPPTMREQPTRPARNHGIPESQPSAAQPRNRNHLPRLTASQSLRNASKPLVATKISVRIRNIASSRV